MLEVRREAVEMRIEKEKAQEIVKKWGYKRLPRSGRQYLRVGCGYTMVIENCLGQFYYGWIDSKGQANLFSLVCLVYLGFMLVVLLTIF